MAADGAQEDNDGQVHDPFMVRHAQVWSRACTVQLVPGGSAAVQCFNSKHQLHCKKKSYKLTCNWAHGVMISGHPTSCLLRMVLHNPTCSRKGCWSVSPMILVILLWTSGRGTWIVGHLILIWADSSEYSSRRRGTWDGKSFIHPHNLWVRGSNLTGGQPAKLPSFGGYSLETLPYLILICTRQQQTLHLSCDLPP